MSVDRPVPLASPSDMDQSTLRELIAGVERDEQDELMMRATRSCEAYCGGRRLTPFVGVTESHRAEGADPSEVGLAAGGDVFAVLGMSYARGLGVGGQVRKLWVDQYAPLFPEMWSYTSVRLQVIRSAGVVHDIPAADLLGGGIEPDTGEMWFRAGTYLPVGSRVRVTYSGGYHTTPLDLVNACRWMAAAELIDEDAFPGTGPGINSHADEDTGRGDGGFLARAHRALAPYRARR